MKKILLTGGSGFIGRHSIPFLLDKGYEVHAVFHAKEPNFTQKENLFWHQCNLLNPLEQKQLLSQVRPSHLLHLAWYAVPGQYWMSRENFRWVQASLEVIMNFVEQGGLRIVVAGTSAEYDWSYGYCSEKVTPLQPSTPYGTCKNSLHEMVKQFSNQTGLSYAWGRVFFLYGPYEYPERLVASVICSLLKNQDAYCLHGNLIRDFLHVQDVASAFVSLLESNVTGPVNIASGNPTTLKDVVNTIADKLNKKELVRFGESASTLNEPRLLVAEVKRLNSEVGWMASYDLDRGLEQTIDWWKNHILHD
ncbi:MAG TPA: NAD(P)-dependent oxidoreductase [Proteobacteria bacterium]|nr:NAD(P)-dependent oxidoreductase [Pseudomonadota bacterium]